MATLFSSFARRGTAAALLCGLAGLLVGMATPQTADARAAATQLVHDTTACEVEGTYDVGSIPTRYQPLRHAAPATLRQETVAAFPAWYGRIVISTYAGCTGASTVGTFSIRRTAGLPPTSGNLSDVTALSSTIVASSATSKVDQIMIQPHAAVLRFVRSAGRVTLTTKTTTLSRQNAQLIVDASAETVALAFTLPAIDGADPMTVTLHGVREMHGVTQGPAR